ncbi:MAG: DUF4040 domain-containing protein [Nostocaceae cyanobacterium]|nr:DUF4040 domain-containing protein [Nostocaceae cyanobacterium]
MDDSYLYIIIALLPLSACMLVFQVNPYHALVIRGILGAVAALVYAVLGAADVALTEALVGTMLAITLYAVAVRSSLIMRLGILKDRVMGDDFEQVLNELRTILGKRHMRLELVTYPDTEALQQGLMDKEVHGICVQGLRLPADGQQTYQTTTRVKRLYEIMQTELSSPAMVLTYTSAADTGRK